MSRYAILDEARTAVVDVRDYDDAWYASIPAESPKKSGLRLLVVDPQPSVTQAQVAVRNDRLDQLVIEPAQVRVTWSVRNKTPAEAEADQLAAELAQIDAAIADLQTQRAVTREQWDAMTANQLRAEQWRDRQILLRVALFFARRFRQGVR